MNLSQSMDLITRRLRKIGASVKRRSTASRQLSDLFEALLVSSKFLATSLGM